MVAANPQDAVSKENSSISRISLNIWTLCDGRFVARRGRPKTQDRKTKDQTSLQKNTGQNFPGHLVRGNSGPAFSACGCGAARTDLCVVDPGGEFLGREAAEDERVNGAEPGARQHRDDRLGYHWHVDEHAVARHHAATLKHRRQLRHLRARTYTHNNDNNEGGFLFQRLSMLIQRFNPVLLHDCFVDEVVGHSS